MPKPVSFTQYPCTDTAETPKPPWRQRKEAFIGRLRDASASVRLVVAADKLAAARDHLVEACLKGGPKAQAAAKELIRVVDDSPMGPDLMRYTASHFSDLRASEEGREGLAAFLDKRRPKWGE